MFNPINDVCLVCSTTINPQTDRHYIEWSPEHDNGLDTQGQPQPPGAYRRVCAACYDTAMKRPYSRRHASDSQVQSLGVPTDHR